MAENSIKHPDVEVKLTGEDGNVFSIMGRTINAMRRAGVSKEDRDAYGSEIIAARSYDEALRITMRWVSWS
jgi:hypothetical protein